MLRVPRAQQHGFRQRRATKVRVRQPHATPPRNRLGSERVESRYTFSELRDRGALIRIRRSGPRLARGPRASWKRRAAQEFRHEREAQQQPLPPLRLDLHPAAAFELAKQRVVRERDVLDDFCRRPLPFRARREPAIGGNRFRCGRKLGRGLAVKLLDFGPLHKRDDISECAENVKLPLMQPLALALLIMLAQADPVSRSWNQPVEPFRIAGNLYYVGASDITSFLITTPEGHILLDGGFVETAPMIRRNIESLGFKVEDVKILISSHAHLDHAGGFAELKRATGATMIVSAPDAAQMARGGLDDPMFGNRYPYPGIYADRIIHDRDTVRLGRQTMTAHITAGHTRGCTTWTTEIRDGKQTHDVVFLCSPSIPSEYKLVNNPAYPEVADDYRRHYARLRTLNADIFLGAHGNFFGLAEKIKERGGKENPFVDPQGYIETISMFEKRFESMLAKQQQQ